MGLEEGSRGWRQKKKGRSKCVSTDRGEGAPLPSGGGLPPTKVEQVLPPELQANGGAAAALASVGKPVNGAASDQPSSSADPAPDIRVAPTDNGLVELSVDAPGSGADTATPEPSLKPDAAPALGVLNQERIPPKRSPRTSPRRSPRMQAQPSDTAGPSVIPAAAEPSADSSAANTSLAETSQAPSGLSNFPRDAIERRVFERLRDVFTARDAPLPHDMLFGFVRSNSKDYTPVDEQRWGDSALALLEEALKLLSEVKVDRSAQRLAESEEVVRDQRLFDQYWPFQELGLDASNHWAVLDRLGRCDFDNLAKHLGSERVLQCYARRFERVRRSKLALADAHGTAAYYHSTVIDLHGLNTSFLRKENRSFIKRTFQFSSKCYPETVHRIYIINCPAAFPMFWKILRPWLDPETSIKIQVPPQTPLPPHSHPRPHTLPLSSPTLRRSLALPTRCSRRARPSPRSARGWGSTSASSELTGPATEARRDRHKATPHRRSTV